MDLPHQSQFSPRRISLLPAPIQICHQVVGQTNHLSQHDRITFTKGISRSNARMILNCAPFTTGSRGSSKNQMSLVFKCKSRYLSTNGPLYVKKVGETMRNKAEYKMALILPWTPPIRGGSTKGVTASGSFAVAFSMVAWIVLPTVLRRIYSYMESAPTTKLLGHTPLEKVLEKVPYELSMCGALEDPARLLATIVTFSHLAYMVAPTSVASHYLTQIWSGATVVSIVWFLYRWKSNVFERVVAGKTVGGTDKERYLTMDRISSMGLLVLGCMAVAEACGMAVQSILTVGGIGGVATAFAAKDVMGNMLCGVGLQFSRPFSVGDSITAGSVNGQVVDMGLHSTQILNSDKYPIMVPNSFFSSQVIVNKSRVRWRGMAFTLPIRLQDLEKIPTITAQVRKMLKEHPKVYLENELPRCHVSRVGSISIEIAVTCNLKPMGTDDYLITEDELIIESVRIITKAGALLGSGTCIS